MFVFTKIYRTYGSFLIWKYFNKCSVFIHFIFITHITNKLLFHSFRRRCYVCSCFDCKYVGSNKKEGKDWNNRFIYFIPFFCGLTPQLANYQNCALWNLLSYYCSNSPKQRYFRCDALFHCLFF